MEKHAYIYKNFSNIVKTFFFNTR